MIFSPPINFSLLLYLLLEILQIYLVYSSFIQETVLNETIYSDILLKLTLNFIPDKSISDEPLYLILGIISLIIPLVSNIILIIFVYFVNIRPLFVSKCIKVNMIINILAIATFNFSGNIIFDNLTTQLVVKVVVLIISLIILLLQYISMKYITFDDFNRNTVQFLSCQTFQMQIILRNLMIQTLQQKGLYFNILSLIISLINLIITYRSQITNNFIINCIQLGMQFVYVASIVCLLAFDRIFFSVQIVLFLIGFTLKLYKINSLIQKKTQILKLRNKILNLGQDQIFDNVNPGYTILTRYILTILSVLMIPMYILQMIFKISEMNNFYVKLENFAIFNFNHAKKFFRNRKPINLIQKLMKFDIQIRQKQETKLQEKYLKLYKENVSLYKIFKFSNIQDLSFYVNFVIKEFLNEKSDKFYRGNSIQVDEKLQCRYVTYIYHMAFIQYDHNPYVFVDYLNYLTSSLFDRNYSEIEIYQNPQFVQQAQKLTLYDKAYERIFNQYQYKQIQSQLNNVSIETEKLDKTLINIFSNFEQEELYFSIEQCYDQYIKTKYLLGKQQNKQNLQILYQIALQNHYNLDKIDKKQTRLFKNILSRQQIIDQSQNQEQITFSNLYQFPSYIIQKRYQEDDKLVVINKEIDTNQDEYEDEQSDDQDEVKNNVIQNKEIVQQKLQISPKYNIIVSESNKTYQIKETSILIISSILIILLPIVLSLFIYLQPDYQYSNNKDYLIEQFDQQQFLIDVDNLQLNQYQQWFDITYKNESAQKFFNLTNINKLIPIINLEEERKIAGDTYLPLYQKSLTYIDLYPGYNQLQDKIQKQLLVLNTHIDIKPLYTDINISHLVFMLFDIIVIALLITWISIRKVKQSIKSIYIIKTLQLLEQYGYQNDINNYLIARSKQRISNQKIWTDNLTQYLGQMIKNKQVKWKKEQKQKHESSEIQYFDDEIKDTYRSYRHMTTQILVFNSILLILIISGLFLFETAKQQKQFNNNLSRMTYEYNQLNSHVLQTQQLIFQDNITDLQEQFNNQVIQTQEQVNHIYHINQELTGQISQLYRQLNNQINLDYDQRRINMSLLYSIANQSKIDSLIVKPSMITKDILLIKQIFLNKYQSLKQNAQYQLYGIDEYQLDYLKYYLYYTNNCTSFDQQFNNTWNLICQQGNKKQSPMKENTDNVYIIGSIILGTILLLSISVLLYDVKHIIRYTIFYVILIALIIFSFIFTQKQEYKINIETENKWFKLGQFGQYISDNQENITDQLILSNAIYQQNVSLINQQDGYDFIYNSLVNIFSNNPQNIRQQIKQCESYQQDQFQQCIQNINDNSIDINNLLYQYIIEQNKTVQNQLLYQLLDKINTSLQEDVPEYQKDQIFGIGFTITQQFLIIFFIYIILHLQNLYHNKDKNLLVFSILLFGVQIFLSVVIILQQYRYYISFKEFYQVRDEIFNNYYTYDSNMYLLNQLYSHEPYKTIDIITYTIIGLTILLIIIFIIQYIKIFIKKKKTQNVTNFIKNIIQSIWPSISDINDERIDILLNQA